MQILTIAHWSGIYAHVNIKTKQRVHKRGLYSTCTIIPKVIIPTFRQSKEKHNETRNIA